MKNEWILDVLADLEAFARQNGLAALATQLHDTRLLAVLELARDSEQGDTDEGSARLNAGTGLPAIGKRV
ncbi:MAG: hypothetical protein ACQEVT_03615 [Pseudomonadota bacterium]|uniref:hypothetical protein n=1 Tax=Roseovarius TaxID=74030 RepID=UPI0022A73EA4|nr:hypothetical protein [Roseovarius sp. EGI FJ00037]MCZ0811540.1 hypothetical protein [Roseovarius sp. EGI FJ00037]